MTFPEWADTALSVVAVITSLSVMLGVGLGILGAGIWIIKKALATKSGKP
jgi:hypothetical protein